MAYEKFAVPIEGSYDDATKYGFSKICKDRKFAFLTYWWGRGMYCNTIRINSPIFVGWSMMRPRHRSPYVQVFNRM